MKFFEICAEVLLPKFTRAEVRLPAKFTEKLIEIRSKEIKLPGFETVRIDNLIQHCSCIICLELPRAGKSVYQCRNGHISCQGYLQNIFIYNLYIFLRLYQSYYR